MNRYTIRKWNPIAKAWGIYHQTFDISDAYATHQILTNQGFKASLTSEYVQEGYTPNDEYRESQDLRGYR